MELRCLEKCAILILEMLDSDLIAMEFPELFWNPVVDIEILPTVVVLHFVQY